MTMHDGVVTLAEDDIPVIVELDDDHVRMSASGTEIGQWRTDECRISSIDDTTFSISAENETLHFVPAQPVQFAAAVNGELQHAEAPPSSTPAASSAAGVTPSSEEQPSAEAVQIDEAPPPKPITMSLFYALSLLTGGLGIWALIEIIF